MNFMNPNSEMSYMKRGQWHARYLFCWRGSNLSGLVLNWYQHPSSRCQLRQCGPAADRQGLPDSRIPARTAWGWFLDLREDYLTLVPGSRWGLRDAGAAGASWAQQSYSCLAMDSALCCWLGEHFGARLSWQQWFCPRQIFCIKSFSS